MNFDTIIHSGGFSTETLAAINKGFSTLATWLRSYAALANGATALDFASNCAVKVTPTANATYTTTVPPAGTESRLMVLTSGASSFTITFGAGFKTTGTLATGTASAKVFVVSFVSDGVNNYETGRTAAMAA